MGAPSRIHDRLEHAFLHRRVAQSNGTLLLGLAYCLGDWSLCSVRDLRRLTASQAREAIRLLGLIDPQSRDPVPLNIAAAGRV